MDSPQSGQLPQVQTVTIQDMSITQPCEQQANNILSPRDNTIIDQVYCYSPRPTTVNDTAKISEVEGSISELDNFAVTVTIEDDSHDDSLSVSEPMDTDVVREKQCQSQVNESSTLEQTVNLVNVPTSKQTFTNQTFNNNVLPLLKINNLDQEFQPSADKGLPIAGISKHTRQVAYSVSVTIDNSNKEPTPRETPAVLPSVTRNTEQLEEIPVPSSLESDGTSLSAVRRNYQNTIISDSIAKYIGSGGNTLLQCTRGLDLAWLTYNIQNNLCDVKRYKIRRHNREAVIGLSAILPVIGFGGEIDRYRTVVNQELDNLTVNQRGVHFIPTWRKFVHPRTGNPKRHLFAQDGWHLSRAGTKALRIYLQGTVGRLHSLI